VRYPESISQLGKNIQRIRKERGMSQQRLALEADVERSVLQRIEYGEGGPTLDILIAIQIALETTIEELFKDVFPEPKAQTNDLNSKL
jgi:transcriptional regulator with XRE-family HTH domain